jgi:Ca2+-binding RTX toxin-like protein
MTLHLAINDELVLSQALVGATTFNGNLGSNDIRSPGSTKFGWTAADFNVATGDQESGWWTWDDSVPGASQLVYIAIVQSGYVTFPQPIYSTRIATEAGGFVILNTDGTYNYSAPSGYAGLDSFSYSFVNEQFEVSQGSVNITVAYTEGANLRPVALDDIYDLNPGEKFTSLVANGVLSNDVDGADGIITDDGLTIQGTTFITQNGGVVSLYATGQFSYTPKAGFVGVDSFNYTVRDGLGATDVAKVTLNVGEAYWTVDPPETTVEPPPVGPPPVGDEPLPPAPEPVIAEPPPPPVNVAPVLVNDEYTGSHSAVISGNVLGNDSDADGDAMVVRAGQFTTMKGGSVTISQYGDFIYTAPPKYVGDDEFEYRVDTGNGHWGVATVLLHVTNAGPTAVADGATVAFGGTTTGNLLSNDTDADKDSLTVTAGDFETLSGGTLSLAADGEFTYVSREGFIGADSVSYTVADGYGGFASSVLTINVLPPVGYKVGTSGSDVIVGTSGADYIRGLGGDDAVSAAGGNDKVYGGEGRDSLSGQAGNDWLYGEAGKDTLNGGDGADWLDGGANGDSLTGGAGADHFVLHASSYSDYDRITDFVSGVDTLVIDLSEFGLGGQNALPLVNAGSGPQAGPHLVYDMGNKSLSLNDGIDGTADILLTTFSRKVALFEDDISIV